MATRKTASPASINTRIDAMNRKANPRVPDYLVVKFSDAVKNAAAPDTMRDYGRDYFFIQWRNYQDETWTTHKIVDRADRKEADRVASGLVRSWANSDKPIMVRLVLPSPATGPRSNPAPTRLVREKKKESFPRFVLEMKDKERDPWMPRESFKTEDEATKTAQTWAKHYPSLWIRVVDLKSK